MTCAEVKKEMAKSDEGFEDGDKWEELKNVEKMSRELYMWLRLRTEGEAKLVVGSLEEEDGIMAWGRLHAKYSQKTMSRLMRLQQECMYPKVAKVGELVERMLQWEEKWKKMEREQPKGRDGREANIPELWKMAAMLKLCPKEIQEMVELRWDEVGEKYETLKDRVIGWATTRTEKKGGAVPMDLDAVEEEEEEEENWWGEVAAVYPTTKCYYCQGFGHMARECPKKGKGKGDKGKGKGNEKGKGGDGGKGWYGKGGGEYGKGGGEKGWKGTMWKGGGDFKGDRTREERGAKEEVRVLGTKERVSRVDRLDTKQQNVEGFMRYKEDPKKMTRGVRRWEECGWSQV